MRGKIVFQANYLFALASVIVIANDCLGMVILVLTAFVVRFPTLKAFLKEVKIIRINKFVIIHGLITNVAVSLRIILC